MPTSRPQRPATRAQLIAASLGDDPAQTDRLIGDATDAITRLERRAAAIPATTAPGFAGSSYVLVPQFTVDTDNFTIAGLSTCAGLVIDASSGAVNLRGMQGGVEGRMLFLIWKQGGTSSVNVTHEALTSIAANRFWLPSLAPYAINTTALLLYQGSRWHVCGHT